MSRLGMFGFKKLREIRMRVTAPAPLFGIACIGVFLSGLTPRAAEAQDSSDWTFVAAAYGWLAGVDGTVALGPLAEVPVDVPFDKLLENLDIAFSLHVEARQAGGWTFLGDLFYADLGVGGTLPVSQTELTLDQKQTVLEGGIGYEVARDLEILGVVRYNDLSVSASTPEDETDERGASWGDGFAGLRFTPSLGDRWVLSVRGDVGAGGSSLAWFGSATVAYALSRRLNAALGYRALSVNYESGTGRDLVRWDMVTHGLSVGLWAMF